MFTCLADLKTALSQAYARTSEFEDGDNLTLNLNILVRVLNFT